MWTIIELFIEFDPILLLFYVLFFLACGILASWWDVQPTPPALEGKVLTSWKSLKVPNIVPYTQSPLSTFYVFTITYYELNI